jgi:hypothetical protein
MDYTEFEFEQRNIDIQIQGLETEIAAMQLQKERLNYEKIKLSNAYNAYLNINQSNSNELGLELMPVENQEAKPRRLKKND